MAFGRVKLVWKKIDPEVMACISGIVLICVGLWFIVDKWFVHAFTYNYKTLFGANAVMVDSVVNHDWVGMIFLVLGIITLIKNK